MALIWIEGFEHMAILGQTVAQSALQRRYTGSYFGISSTLVAAAGRFMGYSLHESSSGNTYFTLPVSGTKLTVGVALKGDPALGMHFINLYTNAGIIVRLAYGVVTAGELTVINGSTNAATSSGAGISLSGWKYVEMQVNIGVSPWTITVRVGGVQVLSATIASGTSTFSNCGFQIQGTTYLDDIYVCDGTGTSNNTFLGDCYVATMLPSGDQSVQWLKVGGGATNSSTLVTVAPDDDTSYVYTSTSTYRDWYTVYQLNPFSGTVVGIQVNADARSDSGTSTYYKTLQSGSQTVQSSSTSLSSSASYSQTQWILTTDPNTSTAWTIAGLETMYVGLLEQ